MPSLRGTRHRDLRAWRHYCDPFSRASIVKALKEAMGAEPDFDLRDKIMHEYTWDGAAADTLAGYKELVRGKA
jgi:hypothetical protein